MKNTEQKAEKIYNINKIDNANFYGETVINYANKKIKKHLGSIPTFPELFIGRNNEVETIHQSLTTKQNVLLLVNGAGGIGKTTLASKYYYQYRNYYQHLVWVFSGTSIIDALLTLAVPLSVEFPPEMPNEERFSVLLQAMAELNEPCLLIIDNANEIEDIQKYHGALLQCANFHILLTTRVNKEIHNTELYQVLPLDKTDALLLFKKHYPAHDAAEDALFFSLFEQVDSNTLVVELLAKNLSNFNNHLKKRYALSGLLADISMSLLNLSKSKTVNTFYQAAGGIQRSETPENIIAAMYDIAKLSEVEQKFLAIFSVLPAESIPFLTLESLVTHENLDEILIGLFEKGWLDYDKENGAFRISPVVQEVVRQKNDNLYGDCEELISRLIDKLDYDGGHLTGTTYEEATILSRYGESIVYNLNDLEDNIFILCERIGTYYKVTGNLKKALGFFERDKLLRETSIEYNSNNFDFKYDLAISYGKLGETHLALNNLEDALHFFKKYSILKKTLLINNPNNFDFKYDLAVSYEKLGATYFALDDLKSALYFFKKGLELQKELHSSHPNNSDFKKGLGISYSKLGEMYSALGNFNISLDFFEKFAILFEELSKDYPNNVGLKNSLAISYSKLGQTHFALNNSNIALKFLKKNNQLEKELYDSYRNNVEFKYNYAISLKALGQVYLQQKKLNYGKPYFEKALPLFKELYETTQIVNYYQKVREIEAIIQTSNSGCGSFLILIVKGLSKIPFVKKKMVAFGNMGIDHIKDDFKKEGAKK